MPSINITTLMKKRRIFKKNKEEYEAGYKTIANPVFDAKLFKECLRNGVYYDIPQYIDVPIYETEITTTSHIEYEITCQFCDTKVWKKSKLAKFCSNSCRTMNYKEKKKNGHFC